MGNGLFNTPNPSYSTVRTSSPVTIGTSLTSLATAPSIKGADVTKMITFTIEIQAAAALPVTFDLYKDGADMTVPYDLVTDAAVKTYTYTWVDESPGKGKPVYEVRGTSTGSPTFIGPRQLTVHNI